MWVQVRALGTAMGKRTGSSSGHGLFAYASRICCKPTQAGRGCWENVGSLSLRTAFHRGKRVFGCGYANVYAGFDDPLPKHFA